MHDKIERLTSQFRFPSLNFTSFEYKHRPGYERICFYLVGWLMVLFFAFCQRTVIVKVCDFTLICVKLTNFNYSRGQSFMCHSSPKTNLKVQSSHFSCVECLLF